MPAWLIVILCATAAVGFFVIGMSLTLMIKGHFIDSEDARGTAAPATSNTRTAPLKRRTKQTTGPAWFGAGRPFTGNDGPEYGTAESSQHGYSVQNFDRQTNQGLCRSTSLYFSSESPGNERVVPPASERISSPAAVSHSKVCVVRT